MVAGEDAEEGFFDVPDPISSITVVSRGEAEVTLRWDAPCDNARAIERFQLCLQRWSLGELCGPLPSQEEDDYTEAPGDDVLLVTTTGCEICVPAPASVRRALEAPGAEAAMAPPGLPAAAWVSVRASNCEGWAEWAPPSLALFRDLPCAQTVLHSWGLGEDGRLGRGHEALERGVCAEVAAVEALRGEDVHSLALGSHSAALTARDELFVWGTFLAEPGATCGVHDEVDLLVEPALQSLPVVPHGVACGRFVTLVLSAEGRALAWGPNEAYQCGVKGPPMLRSLVELQLPTPVVLVALGEFHGLALTALGTVFSWGLEQGPEISMRTGTNLGKQLGMLPQRLALNQPEPRALDVPGRVTCIWTGAYHSALITADGRLWLWGSNDYGQLGFGKHVREIRNPQPLLSGIAFASLGGFHSAAVDADGQLFTWGDNKRGQCGQGEAALVEQPTRLLLTSAAPSCVGASCGGFFSLFEADRVYACGWGKEGCLGFGQACKRMLRPQPVPAAAPGRRWVQLRAGMVHVAGLLSAE